MATIVDSVPPMPAPSETVRSSALAFLIRVWKFLATPSVPVEEPELTFVGRVRKFLWLSSGLFSAGSFAISAFGLLVFGAVDAVATNFLAAVVSACLFGFASLLHFGPDTA